MKEVIDTIVVILFVLMVFAFIRGFNKQQIDKHNKKLDELEKKEKIDE